jgi:hypothetical protein
MTGEAGLAASAGHAVAAHPASRPCVLPHTEGPWGPRGLFALAVAVAQSEEDCTRLMAQLLRARQAGPSGSTPGLDEGAGAAGAVVWGDDRGVCWRAAGELTVAILGVSGCRFLHRGGTETTGRAMVLVKRGDRDSTVRMLCLRAGRHSLGTEQRCRSRRKRDPRHGEPRRSSGARLAPYA